MIFETHFSVNQVIALTGSGMLILSSILCFVLGKNKIALALLILGGLSFRLLFAAIDPFLHMWDEQFHAQVALNMVQSPFHPMLYINPAFPIDPANWAGNSTWLHKQPLFLWQMALSLKIFGKSFLALRLPMVLLSTLCIPVIYRMGQMLYNESCAYLAALLLAVSNLHIDLVSGRLCTDHNDVSFYCYITFSIWTWLEYRLSGKSYWLILTGLFSGMAVLVKWLPGLLVFGGWGAELLFSKERRRSLKEWKALLKCFFICLLVFMPWQIYTHMRWPAEQAIEYHLNTLHLFSDFGHPGPWWFHFTLLPEQYGILFVVLAIAGVFVFLKRGKQPLLARALLFNLILVYCFFCFVKAKMPMFCLIVSPILILIASSVIGKIIGFVKLRMRMIGNIIVFCLLTGISIGFLNVDKLESVHTNRDEYRKYEMQLPVVSARVKSLLGGKNCILFNCGSFRSVSVMYYTGMTSYDFIPSEADCRKLESEGKCLAVFDYGKLPDFISADNKIIVLPIKIE